MRYNKSIFEENLRLIPNDGGEDVVIEKIEGISFHLYTRLKWYNHLCKTKYDGVKPNDINYDGVRPGKAIITLGDLVTHTKTHLDYYGFDRRALIELKVILNFYDLDFKKIESKKQGTKE